MIPHACHIPLNFKSLTTQYILAPLQLQSIIVTAAGIEGKHTMSSRMTHIQRVSQLLAIDTHTLTSHPSRHFASVKSRGKIVTQKSSTLLLSLCDDESTTLAHQTRVTAQGQQAQSCDFEARPKQHTCTGIKPPSLRHMGHIQYVCKTRLQLLTIK